MKTTRLGNTEFEISAIGFGAWAAGGGDWMFGWGDQDDQESVDAIRRAVDRGINWIDTAAVYGLGHSEEVVARAMKDMPAAERPLLFTKCGLVWDDNGKMGHSLKKDSILREVEDSLRRLQVDAIDLYQIHWPTYPPGNPAPDLEEGWSTLLRLKQDGKVRAVGVSNFDVAQLKLAQALGPVSSLQPPYSLLKRDIETEILPFCKEQNIGVIVYSPMQSGMLSGKMTRERVASLPDNDWRKKASPDFKEPKLSKNLQVVERLREIGARHGRSPAEVAIAWTLENPAVTGAIVGARRPEQVDGIVGAAGVNLTDKDLATIDEAVA